jgi:glutamate synthase domain-containing protein 3
VGTVAAGVAKAGADVVLISGEVGGTGASPLSSIRYGGLPWELGLSETQQTLVQNGLRDRVVLECDGQLKTAHDVAVACLLGAQEFGFGTISLVALGCVMMRVCHLNTCPVGIATQDPELRKKFTGRPEHLIRLMRFIAEDLRTIMARLGFRSIDEMAGRVDRLNGQTLVDHWKARGLDLSPILHRSEPPPHIQRLCIPRGLMDDTDDPPDSDLVEQAAPALEGGPPVTIRPGDHQCPANPGHPPQLRNRQTLRRRGAARRHHCDPRPVGSAGQSFFAFGAPGITVRVKGDANDYFGKGLSGAMLAIRPPDGATFAAEENIIIGNVALYGATSGRAYIRGRAGERFGVRNSGAVAVVEGVGDHGCEYMTGGRVVVLGPTGRNFAAGMSGGIAYVHGRRGDIPAVRLQPRIGGPGSADRRRRGPSGRAHRAGASRRRPEVRCCRTAPGRPGDPKRAIHQGDAHGIQTGPGPTGPGRKIGGGIAIMGKPTGFMEHDRQLPDRRPVEERVGDFKEIYQPFPERTLRDQAARCMDCGVPTCHAGCPLATASPTGTTMFTMAAGKRPSNSSWPPTTFPNLPAASARHPARKPAYWRSMPRR